MFKFEELRVYQEALLFVDMLYDATRAWPRDEMFGLINQLRRAATSIVLNIAEGSSRGKKDFIHFLNMAKGSCFECIAILTIAKNRKYINEEKFQKAYENCLKLAKMLTALQKSLHE